MLKFLPSTPESDLRLAILECGRICYDRHLTTANDGNISVRVGDDRVLITPSGISKGRMEADDLLLVDLAGNVISSKAGRKPSSETPMHLEVYKQRRDARAVIHAHPIFATTLTVAGFEFPNDVLPEVLLTLGDVPVTAYATPSSHEDADAIRPFIQNHNALLLCQHGSLTVGKDLDEALINLERVEHVAEVFWRAQTLGSVKRIPDEAREQLAAIRENFFK
ncbi:MAG: class II aldolase/adducin family protein [Chloroflexi bacterium]|nr:class II aldolase/adducin family protein [Chloroflexota bacterium]